ncbi:GNAT family N-acetyltransferase [Alicyclobacillus fastidiosus]|uniref:GNAT family N-acetyltransferase n=1 Tax=Alicyclobacillus fastidiosus TaxID=392011 RepID=A0ABY6ZQF6_9BACL|nr:GNAT family N-acetyltransferase [Alicyclobacillus fastidiosus]WAH44324.1 GNAT family N-acetyltransferase [Alicyclobacillus fastidiosus]
MAEQAEVQISFAKGVEEERWLRALWRSEWGGDRMVSRGHVYHLDDLQSIVARTGKQLVGAATYRFDGDAGCELMSINATNQGGGVGTKLLSAVEAQARDAGRTRVWLITSNDNVDALRFYQRRGYRLAALYPGAIDHARSIKPAIPLVGDHGIAIHDEIELAKALVESGAGASQSGGGE